MSIRWKVPALLPALLLCLPPAPARAQETPPAAVSPEAATVLVRTNNVLRRGRGSGFVIGDGSWVVTASHVVSADLGKGRRANDQTALVYSPWTGRPYEAKVVAVDGTADIALLRLPQAGFPALPVEGLDMKEAAPALMALKGRPLRLYGFPLSYGENATAASAKPEKNDTQLREVAKRGATNLCVLNECPDAQPGWSGGPVVSTDRGTVVAVFHSLYRPKPDESPEAFPAGSLAGYLGDLLQQAGVKDLAAFGRAGMPTVPRPPKAEERMAMEMRSLAWSAGGNWVKAEAEQREIRKLDPEDGLAQVELGVLLLAQKKDEEALKALQEAVRLAPRSMLAHLYLAKALNFNYDLEGAVRALRTAQEVSPQEVEPQLALAEIYEANQKLGEAEAALRAALVATPEHPALLFQLGNLLLRMKKEEEGMKLFSKAGELSLADSSLAFVHFGYARALENARKLKEAEDRYLHVVRQDPEHALARYYLAQLYLRQNRIEDAQIQLNAGVQLKSVSEQNLRAFQLLQQRINEKAGGE